MRKTNKKSSNQSNNNLATRIRSLQAECERLIDDEAERQKQPGVPVGSIRTLLTAHYPNNIFAAALNLLNQKGN
jgi:hypothetical protein